MQKLSNGFLK